MRQGVADPASSNYFNMEMFLNQLKLLSINSGTERALGIREVSLETATLSNVDASATNVTILASNPSRLMLIVYNDSTSAMYLKFGATASTSSYTVKIFGNGYYESPTPCYNGIIDGIWDSATGTARITELT